MKRVILTLLLLIWFATSALAQTAFDFPNTPTANQIVTGPSNQQFQWDGTKWVALLNAGVGGGFTAGGDLSGTSTSQTVIGIQTKAVPAPLSGYLHYNGTSFVWDTPAGSGGGITLGGDLGGTTTSQTVIGIQTKAVPTPVSGYLHYNGSAFVWDTPAAGGAATSVGTTAPASPVSGQLWFNTADLQTYIWYSDGSSSHWTAIVNQIGSGGGGGGGTVTSIAAGAGLSGGTITTTGTISLNTANANTWTAIQSFNNNDISIIGSGTGYTQLNSANGSATNYAATFPANTGTVAELNAAQAWTANQTFSNSTVKLYGSGSGWTTLTSANSSSTSYTLTIPANTGTLAETNIAQTWTGVQTFSSAPVMSGASITSATIPMAALTGTLGTSQGGTNSGNPGAAGEILISQGLTSYSPIAVSQDVGLASTGAATVTGLRGTVIPALATGYLYYNAGNLTWQTPAALGTQTSCTSTLNPSFSGTCTTAPTFGSTQCWYVQNGKSAIVQYYIPFASAGSGCTGQFGFTVPVTTYNSSSSLSSVEASVHATGLAGFSGGTIRASLGGGGSNSAMFWLMNGGYVSMGQANVQGTTVLSGDLVYSTN